MSGKENNVCLTRCVHEDAVLRAKKTMLPSEQATDLAALFKVLGDPTRVRILRGLNSGELCVCDIAALLCMTISAVSHQLRVLRAHKLVKYRKEGKIVFYSLDDDHVTSLMQDGLDHVRHG